MWEYGDTSDANKTAEELYNLETSRTVAIDAKIGLMYTYDYAYAYQSGGLNCSSSGDYELCQTSWIHLSNNDVSAPSTSERIMSRKGYDSTSSAYYAWYISYNGKFTSVNMGTGYSVRPVFYLTSDIEFVDGIGTSEEPFIIS